MGRPTYVCATCSERFTRKYSGKRHNFNIHSGRSEILPFTEYMAGRSSGKYMASHPSWFRKRKGLQWDRSYSSENHVIADSSFRPETLLQPYPAALPQFIDYYGSRKIRRIEVIVRKA
jgi:hypothetical protein